MEEALMFFWLRKLQPEFFNKEIGDMPIDMEEVVRTLYPKSVKEIEGKGKIEGKIEGKKEGFLESLMLMAPRIAKKYEEELKLANTEQELENIKQKIKQEVTSK